MLHFPCGGEVNIFYRARRQKNAQWSDKDASVVYRRAEDGKIIYPATNDQPTPPGCERIVMRSLKEIERFEKKKKGRKEAAWYDRGSGRGAEKG